MRRKQRLRGQAAATWTAANPILGKYEPGYESDTNQLKIGDGSTAWILLPYFDAGSGAGSVTVEYDPVISVLNAPPAHVAGNRYLVGTAPTGAWTGPSRANNIAESDGAAWAYTVPVAGDKVFVTDTLTTKRFNGTAWVNWIGTAILNNGNSLGATMSIGTNDARPVYFKTSALNRVQITAAGIVNVGSNVYVGHFSTAPGARLHVKGSASTDATYNVRFENLASTTPLFCIGNAGSVAIGTATFNGRLYVAHVTSGYFQLSDNGYVKNAYNANNYIEYSPSTGSLFTAYTSTASVSGFKAINTASYIELRCGNGQQQMLFTDYFDIYAGGSGTPTHRFNSSGNTGFGTAAGAIDARFHIIGSGATSATYSFKVANSTPTTLFTIRDDGKVTIGVGSVIDMLTFAYSNYAIGTDGNGAMTYSSAYVSGTTTGHRWGRYDGATFYPMATLFTNTTTFTQFGMSSISGQTVPLFALSDNATNPIFSFFAETGRFALGLAAATAFIHIKAGTTAAAQLCFNPGVAPDAPVDGDIYYVDVSDRLMFRKGAINAEIISASAVTAEVAIANRTLTITYNGTTYKILAELT